uniref:Uncharacterized protein n=1 Tax=Anopheles melas TaxID=34690 RepID=A0A182TPI7_9DIPT
MAFWRAVFASFELPGEPLGDDSSLPLSSELTEGRRWRTILLLSSFGLKPAELACRLAVADVGVGVIWSDWWARVWAAVAAVCCDWLMSVPFTYCIVPWAIRCFWTGAVEGTAGTAGSGRENRTFRFVFGGDPSICTAETCGSRRWTAWDAEGREDAFIFMPKTVGALVGEGCPGY